jgi:autotransporter-associated beta strand protein
MPLLTRGKFRYHILLLAACGGLGWANFSAFALVRIWTGGGADANWSTDGNWSPVGAPASGDDLVFVDGAGRQSNFNDLAGRELSSITFSGTNSTYTLSGNAIVLDNGVSCQLHGALATMNLALTLGQSQTFGGGSGFLTVNGDVDLAGHNLTLDIATNAVIGLGGVVKGTGDVFKTGTGTSSFGGNSPNTYTGTLTVHQGYFYLGKVNGIAVTGPLVMGDLYGFTAGTVTLNQSDQIADSAPITLNHGGVNLAGHNEAIGALTVYDGEINSGGGVLVLLDTVSTPFWGGYSRNPIFKGAVYLPQEITWDLNPDGTLIMLANVFGPGGIHKTGCGTMALKGTNTFTGPVTVTDGMLEAVDTSQAFASSSGVTLSGFGVLGLAGAGITNVPLTINSASAGILAIYSPCTWAGPIYLNYTGMAVCNAGYFVSHPHLDMTGPIDGPGGFVFGGPGQIQITGNNHFSGNVRSTCALLLLNSQAGRPFVGPLQVGGSPAFFFGPCDIPADTNATLAEVRWLRSYQILGAKLELFSNGLVNINNHAENFNDITFTGGEIDTGSGGQFAMNGPIKVNPAPTSAIINGKILFSSAADRIFNVADGAVDCDLLVNAIITGTPTNHYFVKLGAGKLCLTAANSYDAVTLLEEGTIDISDGLGLSAGGVVISDGATLQLEGSGTIANGFELVGAGVGGTHGAIEVPGNNNWNINGDIRLDASTTFNVGQSGGLGLNGAVYGYGPLIKTGLGNLVLSGSSDNTYTSNTVVSAGILYLSKSPNRISVPGNLIIGPAPAGPQAVARLLQTGGMGGSSVTVNGNSLFDLNGYGAILRQVILNDGGSVQTFAGTLSLVDGASVIVGSQSAFGSHFASSIAGNLSLPIGSTTFNVASHAPTPPLLFGPELDVSAAITGGSSGQITVVDKYGPGQMELRGNNTYFNLTRVYEGTLIAGSSGALGSSSGGTYIYNNASLALDGGINVTGENVVLDSTNNAALDNLSGNNIWGGPILLNRNSSIHVNNFLAANGIISGPGALIKTGLGLLSLGGSSGNTFAGETFVNQGTVYLKKPAAITAIPTALEVGAIDGSSAGTVVNLNWYQIVGNIYVHSQGLYDVNGQQENVDYLGLDGNAIVQTGVGFLTLKTGGAINVTPGVNTTATINHHLHLDSGNHVITVGSGTATPGVNDLVMNAQIDENSTAASIQKEGPGRMRLTLNNTYTGGTVVNAGILQVDGSQTQSPVVVNSGTLQGIGSVGAVDLTSASAALAPGASPGILSSKSLDALGGSGALQIELNGTTPGTGYDQLNVTGSVNLNNLSLKASLGYNSATNDQFTIVANDSTDAVVGTFIGLPQGKKLYIGKELFQITYRGGSGNDVVLSRLITPPPPTLTIQKVAPASVRLLWPINDPPFSLQTATNLTSGNWVGASPPPTVIGTNNVVTNAILNASQLYRLSSP